MRGRLQSGRGGVLVADDDPDARANLRDILVDLGYEVDVAADGCEAVALLERGQYELALLDMKMPHACGLDLFRWARKKGKATRVVIITAFPEDPRLSRALSEGVWRVLSKPVNLPELLKLVEEAAAPVH